MHLATLNNIAMKVKTILIIIIFLLPGFVYAQSEPLKREIRIAEGIIQELFTEHLGNEHPIIGAGNSGVSSDYIPGYGIHFQLSERTWLNAAHISREIRLIHRDENLKNERKSDESGELSTVRKESIEQKMLEYFTQYAPLLQSLPDNEYVRLSTGLRPQQRNIIISMAGKSSEPGLPKLTKWVQKRDLKRFREGVITDQQLIQRIQTADLNETDEKRDFNIFKSILDTAANNTDLEYLRIRSAANYSYMPGFGVQFNLNVSSGGGIFFGMDFDAPVIRDFNFDFDTTNNIDVAIDIQRNMRNPQSERFSINVDSLRWIAERSLDSLRFAMDDLAVTFKNAFPADTNHPEEGELTREKEELYDEIVQTINEYGTTLSSLPNNEFLIVAITWPSRSPELPRKTYLRIMKQDLMAGRSPEIQEIERN